MPITILMGRLTADPEIQQSKNSKSEYINLDLAVTQRSQNENETVYYKCFFNSFLAQRLAKANVTKGTPLLVYGELELHAFTYQQGAKAGQPGIAANVTVKDWQFMLSNSKNPPSNSGAVPNGNGYQNPGNMPPNGAYQNPGNMPPNVPPNGAYQNPGNMPPNGAYQNFANGGMMPGQQLPY